MFKDEYQAAFSKVTASEETYRRVMHMANRKKKHTVSWIGKVLVAAILVSLLAITASAAEFGWFTQFFGGPEKLNQEQVKYLEENTQQVSVNTVENDPNCIHTEVLEFVDDELLCKADANNTHMTKQGEADYRDIRLHSLRLSETGGRLEYYYTWEDLSTKPCSIAELTVIFEDGSLRSLPITDSQRRMYFETEDPIPLEQVKAVRLPDGTELTPQNKVDDGYSLSVNSILTDGTVAYVTLDVTFPEEIPSPGKDWTISRGPYVGTQSEYHAANQEAAAIEDILSHHVSSSLIQDGAGRQKIVVRMVPDNADMSFTPGSQWKLHIDGFACDWRNEAVEAQVEKKYTGQDYIIEGEEVEQFWKPMEVICPDTWDILLTIDGPKTGQPGEVELVKKPVTLSGYRMASMDELRQHPEKEKYGPYSIQLKSLCLSPLSYYIEYTADETALAENPYIAQIVDVGSYKLVMKDGREIELIQYSGRYHFQEPIVLADVDYVLLPDGSRLSIPQ